jgi:hypothetical protein
VNAAAYRGRSGESDHANFFGLDQSLPDDRSTIDDAEHTGWEPCLLEHSGKNYPSADRRLWVRLEKLTAVNADRMADREAAPMRGFAGQWSRERRSIEE